VESRGGSFWYEVLLDLNGVGSIPVVGIDWLPQGWQADLDIELVNPADAGVVHVYVDETNVELGGRRTTAKLTIDGCPKAKPMGVDVIAPSMAGKVMTLRVSPFARVGDCPLQR
jgi:hypothetical protein